VDEAMAIIDEVDSMGGMIKAIESGMAKLKIEESATKKQVLTSSSTCIFTSKTVV
jgi:methylmalonyl-CoA mutase